MKWRETRQYEQPPAGSHLARCIWLIDLGTQTHSGYAGREPWTSRDVRIVWELPSERMLGTYNPDVKDKPFAVSMTVKQSLHPSASLRRVLESWRGRKFTRDEMASFDPRTLLDKPCRLTLIEDGDYVLVDSVAPVGKGESVPPRINELRFLSLDAKEFDPKMFAILPERLREKISASPEYAALTGGQPVPAESEEPKAPLEEDDAPLDDGNKRPATDVAADTVDNFWRLVRLTGFTREEGLMLLKGAGGDVSKALKLLPKF